MNIFSPASSDRVVFQLYSAYYDLLYRDKDYSGETRFVHDQLVRHGLTKGRLLELGCGTGRHALEFAALGWEVKGYDLSPGMVQHARQRAGATADRVSFEVGDIRRLRDAVRFDAVVSLFHVMSYQTSETDLCQAVETASVHLRSGGLFFFDFWFGPAVLRDPPAVREKQLTDDRTSIVRHAVPVHDPSTHTVQVNYEIVSTDLISGESHRFTEQHLLRYFDLPELTARVGNAGFGVLESGRWMERKPAGTDSWYAWLIARKA